MSDAPPALPPRRPPSPSPVTPTPPSLHSLNAPPPLPPRIRPASRDPSPQRPILGQLIPPNQDEEAKRLSRLIDDGPPSPVPSEEKSKDIEQGSPRKMSNVDLPTISTESKTSPSTEELMPAEQDQELHGQEVDSDSSDGEEHEMEHHVGIGELEEQEERERAEKAMEKLQEIELKQFLSRASKQLKEVKASPADLHGAARRPLPKVDDYKKKDAATGKEVVDWVLFFRTYTLAVLDENLPPRFLLPSDLPTEFKLSLLHEDATRIYLSLPKNFWEIILSEQVRKVWRWEDPRRTLKYLIVYSVLWFYDLILFYPFAYLLYNVLKLRLSPPSSSLIIEETKDRLLREKEAKKIEKEMRVRAKLGLGLFEGAATIGEGKLEKLLHLHRARGKRSKGIAAMVASSTAVVGPVPPRSSSPKSPISSPSHSDTPLSGHPEGEPKGHKHNGKTSITSLYRLSQELKRKYGPGVMLSLEDLAVLSEKSRNMYMWRDPKGTWISVATLSVFAGAILVLPVWLLMKLFWLWVGLVFFAGLWTTERESRFRGLFNPLWWIFWACPSDAEHAMFLLKQRKIKEASLPEPATPLTARPSFASEHRPSEDTPPSALSPPPPNSSLLRSLTNLSIGSTTSFQSTSSITRVDSVLQEGKDSFHCVYSSLPGRLTITLTHASFTSTRGFRSTSNLLKGLKTKSEQHLQHLEDSLNKEDGSKSPLKKMGKSLFHLKKHKKTDSLEVDSHPESDGRSSFEEETQNQPDVAEGRRMFEIELGNVSGVKKTDGLIGDGFSIHTKDGREYTLVGMTGKKRDLAFNRLITLTPASWSLR
ncbi:hypothetical protein BT69DRAFT_1283152 [Atractiella rhizophila]|nr:hypothetical protein BT69DRAFT_1283152 [Atractiella rhizophila]